MLACTTAFQNMLLTETLAYAATYIPFYQRLSRRRGQLAYRDLPVLTSAMVAEDYLDFSNLQRLPDGIVLTGGTTGIPGLVFRSVDEEIVTYYHKTGLRPGELLPASAEYGITIHITGAQHGFGPRVHYNQPVISLPLGDIRHAHVIARLLSEGLKIDG